MVDRVQVSASALVPKGQVVLWNAGKIVCITAMGAPIEDAICDHVQLNPEDFEGLRYDLRGAALVRGRQ